MEEVVQGGGALLREHLDDLVAIYRSAFLDLHEADPARAAEDRRQIMIRHADRENVEVLLARADGRAVGFCYTYHGTAGQWWHDIVTARLHAAGAEDWMVDCREIVELHVRPDWQGRGLGRRLLRDVLRRAAERTVVLSALDDPVSRTDRARSLYASEGFVALLSDFTFPGSPLVYAILGRRSQPAPAPGEPPARTASSPS
jgi:GNAT superfamily N-acetyltransferase